MTLRKCSIRGLQTQIEGSAESTGLEIPANRAAVVFAWGEKRIQPNCLMGVWGFQELRITGKCIHCTYTKVAQRKWIPSRSASLPGLARISRTAWTKRIQRRPRRESKVLHAQRFPAAFGGWGLRNCTQHRSCKCSGTTATNSFKFRVSGASARTKTRVSCTEKELNSLQSQVFPKEIQVAKTWCTKACGDQLSSTSQSCSVWSVLRGLTELFLLWH